MTDDWSRLLDERTHCLLAFAGGRGPAVVPLAHWHDGRALWATLAPDGEAARRLADASACTVWLTDPGRVLTSAGEARVFRLDSPVRLALHAGPISGALAALAVRNAGTLLASARHRLLVPDRWRVPSRVVLRVVLGPTWSLPVAAGDAGLPPPLPTVVPADVRRAVAGQRAVVLVRGRGRPDVTPALLGPGFRLTVAGTPVPEIDGPVAVVAGPPPEAGWHRARGLALHGTVAGGRLIPDRATWWRDGAVDTAAVARGYQPGVVLPD